MNTKRQEQLARDIVIIMILLGQSSIFNEAHISGLIFCLQRNKKWLEMNTHDLTTMIEALHNTTWTMWRFEISTNNMIRIT